MNSISIFFIALAGLVLVVTIGYLFFSILNNFQRGVQALESLSSRFSYLPASILLKKLGISNTEIVSKSPTHEIEELIRNCDTGKVMTYCPNSAAFLEHMYSEKLNNSSDVIH